MIDQHSAVQRKPLHRTMKGHLRWALRLLMVPVTYIGFLFLSSMLSAKVEDGTEFFYALGALAAVGAAIGFPIAFLIAAVVAAYGVWRSWRRSNGHFNRSEKRVVNRIAEERESLRFAQSVRDGYLRGERPRALPATDVLPVGDERFLLRGSCLYQRYYGQDVHYSTSNPVALGRPSFVAAVMVTSAVSNASARSSAQARARSQWREHQVAETIVSDHRIWCRSATHGWISFDFGAVTAFYPDPVNQTLVMEFASASPLFLRGPIIPAACIIAIWHRLGDDGLRQHPAIAPLLAANSAAKDAPPYPF